MQEAGYDIVYVNFDQGAGDLRENAYVLMAAIDWVNQEKAKHNSIAPNIVWGQSMGGVIARYALRTMEIESPNTHDVQYYVSHDAPHLGANVPIGFQLMIADLYTARVLGNTAFRFEIEGLWDAMFLLRLNAPRQMLRYSAEASNNSDNAFMKPPLEFGLLQAELTNLGLPQETEKNIAIANGNSNGLGQGFSPGDNLFNLNECEQQTNHLLINNDTHGFLVALQVFLAIRTGTATHIGATIRARAIPSANNGNREVFYNKIYQTILWGVARPSLRKRTYDIGTSAIPLDAAPGGRYRIDNFAGASLATSQFPCDKSPTIKEQFCFIPTVSALNITSEINNPYYQFDERQVVIQNKTSFNRTHPIDEQDYQPAGFVSSGGGAPNNEEHIDFSPSNTDILEEYLFEGIDDFEDISSGGTVTIDQDTYNFGENDIAIKKTVNRTIDEITLQGTSSSSQGRLCVNCNDKIRFTSNSNNFPANTSHFGVEVTAGCDASGGIVVENNGILEIGHNSSKTGELYVREGSFLRIKSGGKVIVRDGSSLIIDDGANFVFEDGASIELPGNNSTLSINGKLTVSDNTTFTFIGDGYLVFDQDVPYYQNSQGNTVLKLDDYWDIGSNAFFSVHGPGSPPDLDHKLIECRKSAYLKMEDGTTFTRVSISSGKVALASYAVFYAFSPLSLSSLKFTAAVTGQAPPHEGLRFFKNNAGLYDINNCVFEHGNQGAMAHWFGGGQNLNFQNCKFRNNSTGFQLDGGSASFINCDFLNNNYTGFGGAAISGLSRVVQCDFEDNLLGINVLSGEGGALEVSNSNFLFNEDGLKANYVDVASRCSNYKDNTGDGIFGFASVLRLDDGAGNEFDNNEDAAIRLGGPGEETEIYLLDGQNTFSLGFQGDDYLDGQLFEHPPQSVYAAEDVINANNNKMPLTAGNVMPVDLEYYKAGSNTTHSLITLHIPNNLTTTSPACDANGNPDPNPLDPHPSSYAAPFQRVSGSGGILVGGEWPAGYTLKQAFLNMTDSVTFSEEPLSDGWATQRGTELLNATLSNPDSSTERLKYLGYKLMLKALNNAYQYGDLLNNEGEQNLSNDTVASVVAIIDENIAGLDTAQSDYDQMNFRFHLDKAQTYRVAGHYVEAIDVLNNSSNWTVGIEQTQRALYWHCICDAEKQYYEGLVPAEEMTYMKDWCESHYAGYNYKTLPPSPEQEKSRGYVVKNGEIVSVKFFPQPAGELITAQISPSHFGEVRYRVIDVMGTVQKQGAVQWAGHQHNFSTKMLSGGAYVLELEFEKETVRKKFLKE